MISVVVLTKNEEEMIRACLESIKWADEIIIVDQGSTDGTVEIAKKYTDKIFTKDIEEFDERRNFGMDKSSGDWVLYVDADERVLKPLKEELLELSKSSNKSAYAISRKNVIFGKAVAYEPYKNDWMIRFFRRSDFIAWVGKVHESVRFNGEMEYTKNHLIHLTHRNVDQIVLKSLNWSNIDAKLRLNAYHPPMTVWRFFRILLSETFEQGIKKRGFFNGEVGVMDSMLQVFSLFITYVRLWQLQQKKPLDQIYQEIDEKLIKDDFKMD